MNISIFDVIGPIMIGPSSSHTAGAVRIGQVAANIANKPFSKVTFGLHGSFAKTYKGHGTDKALLAGVMGLGVDDERLRDAYNLAAERGFEYSFTEIELQDVHENSVKITMYFEDGDTCEVVGSSIGGGQIIIKSIDDFDTEFSAASSTLIIKQLDKKGVISDISYILTVSDINIGVMKISRVERGGIALSIIETDSNIPDRVLGILRDTPNVLLAISVNLPDSRKEIGE